MCRISSVVCNIFIIAQLWGPLIKINPIHGTHFIWTIFPKHRCFSTPINEVMDGSMVYLGKIMHAHTWEREFSWLNHVAVCHCHAALPRVIADSDVQMLAAITALNAQEIKCSTEVIRRVNPRAPRYWVGGLRKLYFILPQAKKKALMQTCVIESVVCALFNTLWYRVLLSESVHLRNVCSSKWNANMVLIYNWHFQK